VNVWALPTPKIIIMDPDKGKYFKALVTMEMTLEHYKQQL